jgi:hypothetical protein
LRQKFESGSIPKTPRSWNPDSADAEEILRASREVKQEFLKREQNLKELHSSGGAPSEESIKDLKPQEKPKLGKQEDKEKVLMKVVAEFRDKVKHNHKDDEEINNGDGYDSEKARLQNELTEERSKVNFLQKELDDLRQQHERQRKLLLDMKQEVEEKNGVIDQVRNQNQQLKETIAHLQQQSKPEREMNEKSALDKVIEQLREDKSTLERTIADLSHNTKTKSDLMEKYRKMMEEQGVRILDLERKLNIAELERGRLAQEKEKELSKLNFELQKSRESIEDIKLQNDREVSLAVTRHLEEKTRQIEELQYQKEKAVSELLQEKERNNKLSKDVTQLNKELEEYKQRELDSESQFERMRQERQETALDLRLERDKHEQIVLELQKEIETQKELREKAQSSSTIQMKLLDDYKVEKERIAQDQIQERERLEKTIVNLRVELEEVNKMVYDMKRRERELEGQSNDSKSELRQKIIQLEVSINIHTYIYKN